MCVLRKGVPQKVGHARGGYGGGPCVGGVVGVVWWWWGAVRRCGVCVAVTVSKCVGAICEGSANASTRNTW